MLEKRKSDRELGHQSSERFNSLVSPSSESSDWLFWKGAEEHGSGMVGNSPWNWGARHWLGATEKTESPEDACLYYCIPADMPSLMAQ